MIINAQLDQLWDDIEKELTAKGYSAADVSGGIYSLTHAAYHQVMLYDNVRNCTKCSLVSQCHGPVTGVGSNRAPVMIVAEAPGENEDAYGIPLVGKSGVLLSLVLAKLGVDREQTWITNAVKCRPPENATPTSKQIDACAPHLFHEIQVIKPKVIITLGNVPMRLLRGDDNLKITQERGTWHTYQDIEMIHTYHPSYLLRPHETAKWTQLKKEFWEDLDAGFTKLQLLEPDYDLLGLLGPLREAEDAGRRTTNQSTSH